MLYTRNIHLVDSDLSIKTPRAVRRARTLKRAEATQPRLPTVQLQAPLAHEKVEPAHRVLDVLSSISDKLQAGGEELFRCARSQDNDKCS